ncbi:MAG: hypothetical protein MK212_04305 [Saprospiraceae bacterium]|nr:hypothetical protein [Saprospiraceae bacterium]
MYKQRSLDPLNLKRLIFLALAVKIVVLFLLWYNLGVFGGEQHFRCTGDSNTYLVRAGNIVDHWEYAWHQDDQGAYIPYIGRMPGYEAFIVPFRFFITDKDTLVFVLGTLQLIIGFIAGIMLGLLFFKLTGRKLLTYLLVLFYSANTYILVFDITILSESLGVSFFIFSVSLFFNFIDDPQRTRSLWGSGAFLCWAIFLRPYFAPFAIIFSLYMLYHWRKMQYGSFMKLVKNGFLFASTLIVFESLWITRNYVYRGEFIPLVKTNFYAEHNINDITKALFRFTQAFGGDIVYWNPDAEITYFFDDVHLDGEKTASSLGIEALPSYIYSDVITKEKLEQVRADIKSYYEMEEGSGKERAKQEIVERIDSYTEHFKANHVWDYQVSARLRLSKSFVAHTGTYNISKLSFSKQNIIQKVFKLAYIAYYLLTILLGIFAVFYFIWKRDHGLLILISTYMFLLCPLVLRMIEYRYALIGYPFLILLFFAMLDRFFKPKIV